MIPKYYLRVQHDELGLPRALERCTPPLDGCIGHFALLEGVHLKWAHLGDVSLGGTTSNLPKSSIEAFLRLWAQNYKNIFMILCEILGF